MATLKLGEDGNEVNIFRKKLGEKEGHIRGRSR